MRDIVLFMLSNEINIRNSVIDPFFISRLNNVFRRRRNTGVIAQIRVSNGWKNR